MRISLAWSGLSFVNKDHTEIGDIPILDLPRSGPKQ